MNSHHASSATVHDGGEISGRVLVVDDDRNFRVLHRALLAKQFDVVTASSGSEALQVCREQMPDLIVLDVEMPELNGYEVCRQLREWSQVPIIFVTAHESLEEHLKAYDAGGNSLFVKPVNYNILLRKVGMAIRQHRQTQCLHREKADLERMAMGFLSSASQSGALLNFMRASIVCDDYRSLAQHLVEAIGNLGLSCSVRIMHADGPSVVTDHGEPTPLELSIFDHIAEIGRIFQFKKRLVVNYERASIIVSNMPDENEGAERAGILRDSLAILAETAEGLAINVDVRKEAQRKAEQMQIALTSAEHALNELGEKQRHAMLDTRLLLQKLIDDIESAYGWLNTSQTQENTISKTMSQASQRVIERLTREADFDAQFAQVMKSLRAGRDPNTVELF